MTGRSLCVLIAGLTFSLGLGCGQQTAAPDPAKVVVKPIVEGPSKVELYDAKITLQKPNLVEMEVKYRFVQGAPNQWYSCDISFPGTSNHGVKKMQHWELKIEGTLRDTFTITKPGVTTFELRLSEAPSPREKFNLISNVLAGPVE